MFDLRQLRYFVAVAESLSFTRAAEKLHISQPPLSQQIRALEEDLGARLFNRNKRRVALTEPGRLLLEEARAILARAETARMVVAQAADGCKGRLRLAYPASLSFHGALPQTLLRFSDIAPDVRLELHEMYTETQYDALISGDIDVGLVRAMPKEQSVALKVQVDPIDNERLMLAMPTTHPLASRKRLHLHEVANEPFVTQPRAYSTTLYDTLMQMAAMDGFHPVIRQEAQQLTGLLALVSAGVGLALVPTSLQVIQLPGVRLVELADRQANLLLAAAWRKQDASPVLERFLEAVGTRDTSG